jgi:hypothetical protein
VENTALRNNFTSNLELLQLMLDYNAHVNDKSFQKQVLVPHAEGVIAFYDKHYERDSEGKLHLSPSQSLDTWTEAVNPLPDVAGLKYTLNGVLNQKLAISKQAMTTLKRLLLQLPEVPQRTDKGKALLLPAARVFGEAKSDENPELHAVFPFRLYGVNKPDLELARNTFEARRSKGIGGVRPDGIHAAHLGLTSLARQIVTDTFRTPPAVRFPAFWGPNNDWMPDQDHGNIASLALQSMLIQSEGTKIVLFPAWPKEWDVDFKLRAPQATTVEGTWRGGKLERLVVTPEKRMADVIKMDPE